MDIGTIILTIVLVLGGVAVLIAILWAIVAIIGIFMVRKTLKEEARSNLNRPFGSDVRNRRR